CLKTAAEYHELTNRGEDFLWVGISGSRNVPPKVSTYVPLEIYWQDVQLPRAPLPEALKAIRNFELNDIEATEQYLGIETHQVFGEAVKVTSPARTIIDLLLNANRSIRRNDRLLAVISPEYAFTT